MTTDNRVVTLGTEPSFGFGDRIGLATPGHVDAMREAGQGIRPIYPQQSIREMTRTGRTATGVMDDALRGMQKAGWEATTGADADHLKTTNDVDVTYEAGFTFFTIDPSDYVDAQADDYPAEDVLSRFDALPEKPAWVELYEGRQVTLAGGTTVDLDPLACRRAAVKYGAAIEHAVGMSDYIAGRHQQAGRDFEIELSVDETPQPTTLAEHYIIADQCLQRGMKLVSLAPRFIGDFEKGVDYKGDLDQLERSLEQHAAIAKALGPYKLSLHSGSDKLSMYRLLARTTAGMFHVKTAGTSYVEALRVLAIHDERLLREVIRFSRDRFETDRATYHLSATLQDVPPVEALPAREDVQRVYLERWQDVPEGRGFTQPGRQIVHCTFGSVLTHPEYGPSLKQVLTEHQDTYREVLRDHFARHLRALQAGM